MVQPGGPAAINGFLYQILSHLAWLTEIQIHGQISGNDVPVDVCIVLEPKDGGDARCEAAGIYLVEQYKARIGGTWSVRSIINDILPDLRKAVQEPPNRNAVYRFVTDGRKGRLDSFENFLAAVRSTKSPNELNDTEVQNFGDDLPTTFRALFSHLVTQTARSGERNRNNPEASVFDLLSKLEMEFEVLSDHRILDVEKLLRLYCPNLGDEKDKRLLLVGMLMDKLSTGETRIDKDNLDIFFKKAGLNPDRMRKLAALNETLASFINDELNRIKYRPEVDVRGIPEWPQEIPILLISGGSGNGKTWQLAKMVQQQAESRQSVVWIPVSKDVDTTLARAMQVVWQDGLGETNTKTPSALTAHYRELVPETAMPWLTIAVDDVQDPEVAKDLVRQPWRRWGMRLVMTSSSIVALTLAQQDGVDTIRFHSVGPFSIDEVDALLGKYGRCWADLPRDLRKLLRTPILAGLYLTLPCVSILTAPTSEYEIFESYWNRKGKWTRLGDEGVLLALAARVIEGRSYPVTRTDWRELGLNDDVLARLLASGWLQCLGSGDVAFLHDRLLNWAAAEELVHRLRNGTTSATDVGEVLLKCTNSFPKKLDYVTMDFLWLVSDDPSNKAETLSIIARLENSPYCGSYGEDLYVNLLPTLGRRGVPLLIARLDDVITSSERDYRVQPIAQGLAAIAAQENVDLSEKTIAFLNSSSPDSQSVGITMATAVPAPLYLDRLWELHLERSEILDAKKSKWGHFDYDASIAALHAGVQSDPNWLRDRILKADPDRERVSELAYLLNNLDHPNAQELWYEVKDSLVAKISANKPRSLLYCIGRFRDRAMMDFLIACLGQKEDFANTAAFSNLVKLDPDVAIERLVEIPEFELAVWRNWWLPTLLYTHPEQTRRKLLRMAEKNLYGRRLIEDLFTDRADDLNHTMLQYHLRAMEADLRENICTLPQRDHTWLFHSLQLLANITSPELLEVLAQEAGSELENLITKVACNHISHLSGILDIILENARHFLICVGGEGITILLNHELGSPHYWGRYGGLEWAFVRPNTNTVQLLASIAKRISTHTNGKLDNNDKTEYFNATRALAAIGEDEELVDALWHEAAADLVKLRDGSGPMNRTLTDCALTTLSDPAATDDAILKALTIAWLSSDSAFIPSLRTVLSRSEPASKAAGYACIALNVLGDRSPDLAELLIPLLSTQENRIHAMNAFLSMGCEDSLRHLLSHIRETYFVGWGDSETELVMKRVYAHPKTRLEAIEWAVRLCKEHVSFSFPYEIAGESPDPEVRELITDTAFGEQTSPSVILHAIKGLAKFDVTRANQAIERHLRLLQIDVRSLCKLLARLCIGDVARRLIAVAVEREDSHSAVGHALRGVDPKDVDTRLTECMRDPRSKVRAVGADLAGWQPSDRLASEIRAMMEGETEEKVRQAALGAIDRKKQENIARNLLAAFEVAPNERRWPLLLALTNAVDPFLLHDSSDPLWIGHVLDKAPYIFRRYAEKAINERKSKIN
ncbi:MAG: hypothetical protein MUO63_04940 [Desulfobulbaceae bacterium]|nr:hypothetical protein [Desulfobulbaceae bacterium]